MAFCTMSGHLLLSKLSQRIQVSQLYLSLFNYLFFPFWFWIFSMKRNTKLSGILMDGMVPTITWKKNSLAYGALRSLMLMETQLYLTIQEWSLGSNIVIDFGLIASALGLNMPPSILPDWIFLTMCYLSFLCVYEVDRFSLLGGAWCRPLHIPIRHRHTRSSSMEFQYSAQECV